jgi:hypothetical protein
MRRVPPLLGLALVCAGLASGCKALVVAKTTVKEDGSWTRTVRFRGRSSLGELKGIFLLPSGGPWKTSKEWAKQQASYTAQRRLRSGETLRRDVVVGELSREPAKLLSNEVTVHRVAPGRLEYRERLRWHGGRPKALVNPERRLLHRLQQALPSGTATEADTREVTQTVLHDLWRLWFGPGLPFYDSEQDDLAERRLKRLLGMSVDRALWRKYGERLSDAQRRSSARRWVAILIKEGSGAGNRGPLGLDDLALVPLLFSVQLPGRVVATNGEYDEVAGEVFWGLFPEAAASGDVVLRATCELAPAGTEPPDPFKRSEVEASPALVNGVPRSSPVLEEGTVVGVK